MGQMFMTCNEYVRNLTFWQKQNTNQLAQNCHGKFARLAALISRFFNNGRVVLRWTAKNNHKTEAIELYQALHTFGFEIIIFF